MKYRVTLRNNSDARKFDALDDIWQAKSLSE